MSKHEEKEIKKLQMQWVFVIVGAIAAFFIGVTANAFYDLLVETHSRWLVLVFFGVMTFIFLHFLTYMFENLKFVRENHGMSFHSFFAKYIKESFGRIYKK